VTRNAGIARIMHMSYRSKTYTWNDVILVKRSMIRVFCFTFVPYRPETTKLAGAYIWFAAKYFLLQFSSFK